MPNKICTRCKIPRDLALFRWLKKHHRGKPEIHRDSWCADCRKAYKRTPEYRLKQNNRFQRRYLEDPEFREKAIARIAAYKAKDREAYLARQRESAKKNGGYLNKRLLAKFGITTAEYCAMRDAQNKRCAICNREESTRQRRLAVDHDHALGVVRGLLCHHCNTGLGNFFDDPALLFKAVQYLAKHSKIRDVS